MLTLRNVSGITSNRALCSQKIKLTGSHGHGILAETPKQREKTASHTFQPPHQIQAQGGQEGPCPPEHDVPVDTSPPRRRRRNQDELALSKAACHFHWDHKTGAEGQTVFPANSHNGVLPSVGLCLERRSLQSNEVQMRPPGWPQPSRTSVLMKGDIWKQTCMGDGEIGVMGRRRPL